MNACVHCQDLRRQLREAKEELAEWERRGGALTPDDLGRAHQIVAALRAKQLAIGRCTAGEIRVLLGLLATPGRACSLESLLFATALDGERTEASPKLVQVRVCRLRKVLGAHGLHGVIRTLWGHGFEISVADAVRVEAWLEGLVA